MQKLELIPVRIVEAIRSLSPRIYVWYIESAFVFLCLALVATIRLFITGHGWVEWIGVAAVWLTFSHASVANRLEEKEHKRVATTGKAEVECYRWLQRYFYGKETCWLFYFVLIGAYSALVGVGIFLAYGWWRKTWRKYHPLEGAQPAANRVYFVFPNGDGRSDWLHPQRMFTDREQALAFGKAQTSEHVDSPALILSTVIYPAGMAEVPRANKRVMEFSHRATLEWHREGETWTVSEYFG